MQPACPERATFRPANIYRLCFVVPGGAQCASDRQWRVPERPDSAGYTGLSPAFPRHPPVTAPGSHGSPASQPAVQGDEAHAGVAESRPDRNAEEGGIKGFPPA
jgi:hypothetical protein